MIKNSGKVTKKLLMLANNAGDIKFIGDSLSELPTLRQLLEEKGFYPLGSATAQLSLFQTPMKFQS